MKILTLNYHFGNNYGAVLEAYALQTFLHKYSNNVRCLDFEFYETRAKKTIRRFIKLFFSPDMRRRCWKKILSLCSPKECEYIGTVQSYKKSDNINFKIFRDKFLMLTDRKYHSIKALRKLCTVENVDVVVCGSDVIWHVGNESLTLDVYFLAWTSPNVLKIAYAPSWGRPCIDDLNIVTKSRLTKYLSEFRAVSVREKSGVDICASLGRCDAQWVPDPTMLLTSDVWDHIAESRFHGSYILNYHIPYNKSINDTNIIPMLEQYYKAPIKKVPDINSEYVWLSPTEWLGGIRDAEFVITNSFHGVVFCIIYNKNFLFTKLIAEHEVLNERIYSLLDLFDLRDRIVTEETISNIDATKSLIESPINWEQVNKKLVQWRQVGIDFLDKTLKTSTNIDIKLK